MIKLITKNIINSNNKIKLRNYLSDINIMYRKNHKKFGIIDMNQYMDFYDGTVVYNIYDFSSEKNLTNYLNCDELNSINIKYDEILYDVKNMKLFNCTYI